VASTKKSKRNQKHGNGSFANARGFVLFVAGTVLGLYIVRWFVAMLPGPNVEANVQGLRVLTGNAAGCTSYMFTLSSDEPIDFASLRLQFPTQITNYRVGYPMENETSNAGPVGMQAWEIGRNEKGECAVVQAAINNSIDVQVAAAGNQLVFHGSKLSAKALIWGMVATSEDKSSVTPAPNFSGKGEYEYYKLGQPVRGVVKITNVGVFDAK
jgi:hypothetical protein